MQSVLHSTVGVKTRTSSIFDAVRAGDAQRVRQFLAADPALVRARDFYGFTPLDRAILDNQAEMVKMLLASGADPNAKNRGGATPLHGAAARSTKEVLSLLLASCAEVNATRDNGETPLHWGAAAGNVAAVELLLSAGAEVNAREEDDWTSLHCAAEGCDAEAPECPLVARLAGIRPAHWLDRDHAAVARTLLARGADVNARSLSARTPLYVAAGEGREDVVEILLANGADPNACDEVGRTPLHHCVVRWTVEEDNVEIAEGLLLGAGTDRERLAAAREFKERAEAAMLRLRRGRAEVIGLRVARGADMNARTPEGETALSFAMSKGETLLATVLRQHGGAE